MRSQIAQLMGNESEVSHGVTLCRTTCISLDSPHFSGFWSKAKHLSNSAPSKTSSNVLPRRSMYAILLESLILPPNIYIYTYIHIYISIIYIYNADPPSSTRDPSRPIYLGTPINGFFRAAGERGAGIALLLQLAQHWNERIAPRERRLTGSTSSDECAVESGFMNLIQIPDVINLTLIRCT